MLHPYFVVAFMMMGDPLLLQFTTTIISQFNSSNVFPPHACCFVISDPQVRSHLPHFTLISFLVVRPRSALVPPPTAICRQVCTFVQWS